MCGALEGRGVEDDCGEDNLKITFNGIEFFFSRILITYPLSFHYSEKLLIVTSMSPVRLLLSQPPDNTVILHSSAFT